MSWLRSLAIGVVVAIAAALGTWFIAMEVAPPVTSGGHKTMALGHAMLALLAAAVGLVGSIVLDRLLQARRRAADIQALERGELRSLR